MSCQALDEETVKAGEERWRKRNEKIKKKFDTTRLHEVNYTPDISFPTKDTK